MTALPPRFLEDRALRDAARRVLEEDIARLRASLAEQGVASRVSSSVGTTVTSRLRAGAQDVIAQARQSVSDNPGIIALVIGAILLWLMRGTILDLVEAMIEGEEDTAAAPADSAAATDQTGAETPEAIEDQPA
jgi:DNA-binding GntR family transcriptional regulator